MAANTIIQIPDGVVVYTAAPNGTDPKSLDRSNTIVYNGGMMTLPYQSLLYVGVEFSTDRSGVTLTGLPQLSAAKLPKYKQSSTGTLEIWDPVITSASIESFVTYFFPYNTSAATPAVTLQHAATTAEVAKDVGIPTETSASPETSASSLTTAISITPTSTSPSSTSPSNTGSNNASSIGRPTTPDPAAIASSSIASAVSISAVASFKHTAIGAAIGGSTGGSIGGLIVGIAAALIAFACLRRRALQSSGKRAHRSGAGDVTTDRRLVSMSKEMQFVEVPTAVTGWQKHLPQEKDDRAITEAVKTIFDQIQVHIEGFYNSKPGKITSSAADLERISPDGFSKKLSKVSNSLPILERILIRWIVQRISLRADVEDSFLPFEYTNIPKQNEWHMEIDEQSSDHVDESRKGQQYLANRPVY
jgi:hypothetical protein